MKNGFCTRWFVRLASLVALGFSACAEPKLVCQGSTATTRLSPAHRRDNGFELVSISQSRKVTVKDSNGALMHARPGEHFVFKNGEDTPGYTTLRSVDLSTGEVVIEGMEFAMTIQR